MVDRWAPVTRRQWVIAAIGVTAGIGLVVFGLIMFFGEALTEDEVDCGATPRDLALDRAEVADPALAADCETAAIEGLVVGASATMVGVGLAIRAARGPRLAAGEPLDLERMAAVRRWRNPVRTRATVRTAVATLVIATPIALGLAPIVELAIAAGAAALMLGFVAAVVAGPRIEARTDGLALRSRWFRTQRLSWHEVEAVLPTPQGLLIVTDEADIVSELFGGASSRRRDLTEQAALDIARAVAAGRGAPASDAAVIAGLELPADAPPPDDPVWAELAAEQRAEDRRELWREGLLLGGLVLLVTVVPKVLGW